MSRSSHATVVSVVDAHLHVWEIAHGWHSWIAQAPDMLRRDYMLFDARSALPAFVRSAVLVQAANAAAETDWLLDLAERSSWVAGVVGWIDLTDVEACADRLSQLSRRSKLRGIRHLVHEEADPEWLLQPAVLESLALVARQGLPFDLVVGRLAHLDCGIALTARVPGLRLVLDHLGGPGVHREGIAAWRDRVSVLAESPSVMAKLSGFATQNGSGGYATADEIRSWTEHGWQLFGPTRLMVGSDWPIAALATVDGLTACLAAVDHLTGDPAERDAVYRTTAQTTYGLAEMKE